MRHDITIDRYVKCKCGSLKHHETVVTCSCGWTYTLDHGAGDIGFVIAAHRMQALEEIVGMKTTITYKK